MDSTEWYTIDELDAFVLDESENTDTDGDGIGDNEQALLLITVMSP